jgi:type VI secretion system protein ImpL
MQARTLSILLFVLTAAFIGFAWWVYVAAGGKLHWAIPVMCTVGPIMLGLVLFLSQRLAAHRGAQGLEKALVAEGSRQQQRQVSSVRSAEVERLRNEFDRAVGALKNSKLARGTGSARDALYRLPWYTIIGPPACGKTTVLRNSGLKFPHLAGTGDRLKGIGGTRNCDWWLTNEAILLDTAGRWTLEEDDRDEWHAFLDLLKRHRPGRPLNGVIAAISLSGDDATSIAGVDAAGIKALAGRMRERLDEITGHLGLELPVYLLFTKCDLISGFVETFGEMTPQDRRQIWGFTAPILAERARSPAHYFLEQFELLCNSLEHYSLTRMGAEVRPETISRIYEFPAQLRVLADKLGAFVDELFEESAYGEAPFLRGAYFTSGTQEGAPADLLLENMAVAMNVRPPEQESAGEKKSYFLHDMLMKVVFEDRDMATSSHAELTRQQKRRRIWTTGLFAAATLIASFPTVSCRQNLTSLGTTRALLDKIQEDPGTETSASVPTRVEDLIALRAEVMRYEEGMPSLMAGFGLYQGDDLREPLARYYAAALREWTARPLLNKNNEALITITQQLEGLRQQGAGALQIDENSRRELQNGLKLHLLLTTPREECVPKPLARKDWIVGRMLALWERATPTRDKALLGERRTLILEFLERSSGEQAAELALAKDKRRVDVARQAVGGEDKGGQLLSGMLERFSKDQRDLTSLAGSSTVLSGAVPLHGAFTVEAWRQASREFNNPQAWSTSDESWVLGCQEDVQDQQIAQNSSLIQSEYLRRYGENWARFIGGLSSRSPSNPGEAETMLGELVGRPGVLGNLFQRIKDNTDLPLPPPPDVKSGLAESVKNVAGNKIKELTGGAVQVPQQRPSQAMDKLRTDFQDLVKFGVPSQQGMDAPLEQYRKQVDAVLMALKAYRSDESKIEALGQTTRTALDSIELLISANPSNWSGRLREILIPPIAGIVNIAMNDRGGQVQRSWCDNVFRAYREELAGRYPMNIESSTPASLQAFQRFFQPGSGTIWAFASNQLGAYVMQEGDRFRFTSSGADGRALFREELLTFLNRATEVRKAFFPEGSASIRVPFRLRVRGAPGFSVTQFSVGSKTVRYDSGAEVWVSTEWPGEQPSLGATLAVTPYQGAGPKPLNLAGEWGLFMIFDERFGHGQIVERSERQFTAGWRPKGGQNLIKVDFATDDARSPLMYAPFGGLPRNLLPLAVPARITHSGSGC